MIVYLGFNLQFHGLKIKTRKDLESFQERLKTYLEQFYEDREHNSDLVIDLEESAGSLEN